MIKENTNIKIYFLLWLIVLSFLSRLVAAYFLREVDLNSSNVNEWNILLQNLIKYKSYSLYTINNQPIPSVYIPPIYPFFLYLLIIVKILEIIEKK